MIVVFTHCWTMESKLMFCVHLFIFILFSAFESDNFSLISQFNLLPSFFNLPSLPVTSRGGNRM